MPGPDEKKRVEESLSLGNLAVSQKLTSPDLPPDRRAFGMKDLSRLESHQLQERARTAEEQLKASEAIQALDIERLLKGMFSFSVETAEVPQKEIAEYVARRTSASQNTTEEDIKRFKRHRASRSQSSPPSLTHALLQCIERDKHVLGKMRREGKSYAEREAYIATSLNQRHIKALLFNLGLAELLIQGDWSVNREQTVSEGLGVVPFDQVETLILHFYQKHGLLLTQAPIKEHRLFHCHAGCGNGVLMERLRQSKNEPFGNGWRNLDYWTEIGLADRIYFPLDALLLDLVKEEYRDDPALLEFIKVITTLLLRRIYFSRRYQTNNEDARYQKDQLQRLRTDVNILREIMITLPDYIRNLARLQHIRADGEFLMDTDINLSPVCRALIHEYLEKDPDDKSDLYLQNAAAWEKIQKGGQAKGPVAFMAKYFKPEFLDDKINLNEHITIWPHRILLGEFENIAKILPETPIFDLLNCFRSNSHLENEAYRIFMKEICHRLKPGGIILDDGYRESYTREERFDIWLELAQELGSEWRVDVIGDSLRPKGIIIQRCIQKTDGSHVFLTDDFERKLLLPDCELVPIEDYARTWPERAVRSFVISELKEKVFIGPTFLSDDSSDERASKVHRGRFEFTGLHNEIDRVLEEESFSKPTWKTVREESLQSPTMRAERFKAYQLVAIEIKKVHERIRLVGTGGRPLLRDAKVATYALGDRPQDDGIYRARQFPVEDMPRNLDVPQLQDLEKECRELIVNLEKIRELTGQPPVKLISFDDCFTNVPMESVLTSLLAQGEGELLLDMANVKMKSGVYPEPNEKAIYMIGGSTNDTYDPYGAAFTDRFTVPLLQRLDRGEAVRVFGTCFGSQSSLEAYGRLKGLPIRTKQGAFQFGAFPIRFTASHACVDKLAGKSCTAAFTRSGYTIIPGYEENPDIIPLAYEVCGLIQRDKWEIDKTVPPVAFSLMEGRLVTTQFHCELELSSTYQRERLRQYLLRHYNELSSNFLRIPVVHPGQKGSRRFYPRKYFVRPNGVLSALRFYNNNVSLPAIDQTGKQVHWIAREVGPAFMIPTLLHLSQGLLRDLQASRG